MSVKLPRAQLGAADPVQTGMPVDFVWPLPPMPMGKLSQENLSKVEGDKCCSIVQDILGMKLPDNLQSQPTANKIDFDIVSLYAPHRVGERKVYKNIRPRRVICENIPHSLLLMVVS